MRSIMLLIIYLKVTGTVGIRATTIREYQKIQINKEISFEDVPTL